MIESLRAGLEDGSVVLESAELTLFPGLAYKLGRAFRDSPETASLQASEHLAPLLEALSRVQARFSVAADLKLLARVARDLRLTANRTLVADLQWYVRVIAGKFERLPISARQQEDFLKPVSEVMRLAKMLEIALDEKAPILDELGIDLELKSLRVLSMLLDYAAAYMPGPLIGSAEKMFSAMHEMTRGALERRLHLALSVEINRQIEDIQVRIKTLELALERAKTAVSVQPAGVRSAAPRDA